MKEFYIVKSKSIEEICDAIRSKLGNTAKIPFGEIPTRIRSISGGGGGKLGYLKCEVIEPIVCNNITKLDTYYFKKEWNADSSKCDFELYKNDIKVDKGSVDNKWYPILTSFYKDELLMGYEGERHFQFHLRNYDEIAIEYDAQTRAIKKITGYDNNYFIATSVFTGTLEERYFSIYKIKE